MRGDGGITVQKSRQENSSTVTYKHKSTNKVIALYFVDALQKYPNSLCNFCVGTIKPRLQNSGWALDTST